MSHYKIMTSVAAAGALLCKIELQSWLKWLLSTCSPKECDYEIYILSAQMHRIRTPGFKQCICTS